MSKNKKKLSINPTIRDLSHRCQDCNLVSKAVDKSYKYEEYLCINCLKKRLLS